MLIRTQGTDIPPLPTTSRDAEYLSSRSERSSTGNIAIPEGDIPPSNDPSSSTRTGPESPVSTTPSTGRLMGRFKNFGKAPSRKHVNEVVLGSTVTTGSLNVTDAPTVTEVTFTLNY